MKSTLMQAGKVAGSGAVAGGGFSLAHDIGSTSNGDINKPRAHSTGISINPKQEDLLEIQRHLSGELRSEFNDAND
ncbi:MAG: hypothetical protein ACI4PK_02870 [Oscillospiraceae bacterium]